MGDEFKDVGVGQPITLSLTAEGAPVEAILTLFGFDGSKSKDRAHSVVIEQTDTVPGAPAYPHDLDLDIEELPWWRIRLRRRLIALREAQIAAWERAYADWVADGCPDREVLIRRYIPRARIEVAGD